MDTGAMAAAAGVMAVGAPQNAEAFVFKGKEYFDVFYGIEPLAWAFCGFVIVYYGAVLKNAATKPLNGSSDFSTLVGVKVKSTSRRDLQADQEIEIRTSSQAACGVTCVRHGARKEGIDMD
eukprot:s282_g16.t3